MTSGQSSSNSNSPQKSSCSTAFQWPVPTTTCTDISVKEIIEKYHSNNNDLLKHALMAKSEEDKVKCNMINNYIKSNINFFVIYLYM
jgi:hypothetical protein